MPKLRLAAEIECHPIWLETGEGIENVAPGELPISSGLAAALDEWSERWDALYDMDDPAGAGFPSAAEERRFEQDGRELAARLRSELGPAWTVDQAP
ncbi:hypothetical protein [Streptomyces sp. NPDC049040]|uniref:hypothetical protein n=1 Tax=Streptomyces sp. NPDC049040 TaxID=3365593 RepID=UPI00371C00A4